MTIKGKWKIIEAELGGKKLPLESFDKMVLELDETSYQLIENKVIDSGMVEIIKDSTPKALVVIGVFGPNQGKIQCIYRFAGKDMIMCYNLGGDGVPKKFETWNSPLLYMVKYRKLSAK
jgi:uncharacterized protein (TIGR03067 family)